MKTVKFTLIAMIFLTGCTKDIASGMPENIKSERAPTQKGEDVFYQKHFGDNSFNIKKHKQQK